MKLTSELTVLVRRCLYAVILFAAFATTTNARTLSDLIAVIDSTSPALAEVRFDLARAQTEYTSSRALPNPVLFGEGQRLEDTGMAEREQTVGIRQPLGFLWSQPFASASKRLLYEAARATFEEQRRAIVTAIIVSIAQIKALDTQAVVLDTVLLQAAYVGEVVKARLQQGDISEYQARRIQAELIELQSRRLDLNRELSAESEHFVEFSGMPLGELRDVALPVLADPSFADVDEAVAYAVIHRESLRKRLKAKASARKAVTASTLNMLPDFSLGIARKTADPDFSGNLWQAEVAIPLFGQNRSGRNLSRANETRAQRLYEGELHLVEQQVRSAHRQWHAAQDAYTVTAGFTAEDGQLELNRAVRLFLSGELNTLEFVDALRTNLDALQARLNLEIGLLRANLEFRRVTGLDILP